LQQRLTSVLAQRFARLKNVEWLNATLSVSAPSREGFGMHGSGMLIVNPPWTLAENLRVCLPYLARTLGIKGAGSFSLSSSEDTPSIRPKIARPLERKPGAQSRGRH
jgi:23S rRNA (adenine2030-N6)-methyltransferase